MLKRKDQVLCIWLPEQAPKAQKDFREMREQMQHCRKLEGKDFKPRSGKKGIRHHSKATGFVGRSCWFT